MKSIPRYWAFLAGLLCIAAQVIFYYLRFGRLNTLSPYTDYVFFFLAGSLGGAILIFFLNGQRSMSARRIVLILFLLVTPVSLFLMLIGGLFGPFGTLILPQIPWALFSWIGTRLSRVFARA